jgi:hypothetical protein
VAGFQPQAGGFGFTVPELPRLNNLLGRSDGAADHAHRVFDGPALDWCIHKQAYKVEGICLLALLAVKVAAA